MHTEFQHVINQERVQDLRAEAQRARDARAARGERLPRTRTFDLLALLRLRAPARPA